MIPHFREKKITQNDVLQRFYHAIIHLTLKESLLENNNKNL